MGDISIKINIIDRTYPLRIKAEEEEYVRRAAKLINDKAAFFNSSFSVKDKVDGLAMAALEFTVDAVKQSQKNHQMSNEPTDTAIIEKSINEIESILSLA
jgi:cell division protein ZapA (FtsZ GTPase activity inhibitor)